MTNDMISIKKAFILPKYYLVDYLDAAESTM